MNDLLFSRSDVGEFRRRYRWLAVFAFLGFFAIGARLFQLQIVRHSDFAAVAHENIIRRATLSTTRGVIRDAQGRVIASSRTSYNVHIVPGRVMPSIRPPRRNQSAADAVDTWPRIADTLRLTPAERTRFEARIRAACATDEDKSPCWRSVLVREDVPRDIVAELKQHQADLSGAEVVSTPVRFYPYKNVGAHAIGYVAEIDAETLHRFRPEAYEDLAPDARQALNPLAYEVGDTLGATGVEHAWESGLRGQRGWEKRVVDARGRYRTGPDAERLIDLPTRQEPLAGRDLRLTLDVDLMQAAEKAMRPHAAGAVVIVEVNTGRLLTTYSKPDFDLNDLAGGGGRSRIRETFDRLYHDPLRPLLDKTMSGTFHPGSTFKPFSALAALEDHLMDPNETERCDGALEFGHRVFRCTHVHGSVTMREAIGQSCNVYFFKLAEAVGMDRIAKIANDFGLGEKTGLGTNPESPGRIPTRGWYSLRYRGQFRVGFTLNTAIGQGDTTVTPLQLALAYGALANGGTLYLPQLIRAVETADGSVIQEFPPRIRRKVSVAPENLARIQEGLSAVVNDPKGTAYPVHDPSLSIAGKTGTAQTGYTPHEGDDPKLRGYFGRDHSWFSGFSPVRSPEIAVVVLIEHGGSGPIQAAPVAMQLVREYERLRRVRASGEPSP